MLFLRQAEPNIRRYLPSFIFSDKTADAIARANNSEHEALRLAIADVANQFYVETATWGLTNWERVLDIPTVISDGYEMRRKRILLKLQSTQTSTLDFMNSLLNWYTTDGKGFIAERNTEYAFDIVVDVDTVKNWREMSKVLYLYKPAHLGMYFIMKSMQKWEIRHRAECEQIVDAYQKFWNLGSIRTVRRDGEFLRDGTIRRTGKHPIGQYCEQQAHRLEVDMQVDAAMNGSRIVNCRDGTHCRDGSHRRNGAYETGGMVSHCCTVSYVKNGLEVIEYV